MISVTYLSSWSLSIPGAEVRAGSDLRLCHCRFSRVRHVDFRSRTPQFQPTPGDKGPTIGLPRSYAATKPHACVCSRLPGCRLRHHQPRSHTACVADECSELTRRWRPLRARRAPLDAYADLGALYPAHCGPVWLRQPARTQPHTVEGNLALFEYACAGLNCRETCLSVVCFKSTPLYAGDASKCFINRVLSVRAE